MPWCGLVEVRASTFGEEKAPAACFYGVKFKMDEMNFECAISSKVDVIDRMKIKFFTKIWHPLRYMYVKRCKASMLVTPVAVHEQCNAGGKQLPVTRRLRILFKYVLLFTYLTVIKHVHERASFCNISKAGLATGRKVMSPVTLSSKLKPLTLHRPNHSLAVYRMREGEGLYKT